MKIVLINNREPFDLSYLDPFRADHEVICCQGYSPEYHLDDIINRHKDADILIVTYVDLNAMNLAKFNHLKAIIATTTAVEYIDLNYAKSQNILVFNNSGYTESAVAEHLMSLMLSVARRIPSLSSHTKAGDFEQFDQVGFELSGKRLGILGMGAIGQRFAKLVSGLNMDIQYYNRSSKDIPYPRVDLDVLMSSSDVIAVTLPLNEQTSKLFNQASIAMMKNNSIIVSISPDGVFDFEDVIVALQNNKFFGLGLDIHHPHPELYTFDNVTITPTKAWYTKECLQRRTRSWVNVLEKYLTNSSDGLDKTK